MCLDIGELTSATSKERMTMNIVFAGATPILINEKFICQLTLYSCMAAPLHNVIDRREHEIIFSCHYMEIWKIYFLQCEPPNRSVTVKRQKC